ncbi:MAG: OmpA family protein [Endozoicomonas sp.]
MTRTFSRSFTGLAVAVIACASSASPAIEKGPLLSLGAAYTAFDSIRELDNNWGPEIGVGYRFDERFSLEAIYSEIKTDQKNDNSASLKNYRADLYYDLDVLSKGLTPYLVLGAGELQESLKSARDREDTRLSFGGGLRKDLTDNLALRGGIRAIRSLDYNQTEAMINLALVWTFGTAAKPAPTPQPVVQAPVKKQPVVVAPPVQEQPPVLKPDTTVDLLIEFENDSAVIREQFTGRLLDVVEYMQNHPYARIQIQGHTDGNGSVEYNMKLSQDRADAVKSTLVESFGINSDRIEAKGYGPKEPVADNSTVDGRQKNRRVEAELL